MCVQYTYDGIKVYIHMKIYLGTLGNYFSTSFEVHGGIRVMKNNFQMMSRVLYMGSINEKRVTTCLQSL